jgi:segregation and condensation protein A
MADNDHIDDVSDEDWESRRERVVAERGEDTFIVNVEGYEGPLDLMLSLARAHKLDLTRIPILYLAEQYLEFIDKARALRLDIAADYLVMAAWLTYLKSRLLLPQQDDNEEEPTGDELAARLAFRLQRLEAMRGVGEILLSGQQLQVDFYKRGMLEGISVLRKSHYDADIYDLLAAYASGRLRKAINVVRPGIERRRVWSIKQAREQLERMIGFDCKWAPIDSLIAGYLGHSLEGRTVLASAFGASLEMAREGLLDLRQDSAFKPLYLRRKDGKK